MKIIIGAPNYIDAANAAGRTVVNWKENRIILIATGISVFLYVLFFALWPDQPNAKEIIEAPLTHIGMFIAVVILMLILHELLHLAAVPRTFLLDETTIGFNPQNLMFFAQIPIPLTKNDAIRVSMFPFIFLTMLPFGLRYLYTDLSGWFGVLAATNAGVAGFDIFVAAQILIRVPSNVKRVSFSISGISVE